MPNLYTFFMCNIYSQSFKFRSVLYNMTLVILLLRIERKSTPGQSKQWTIHQQWWALFPQRVDRHQPIYDCSWGHPRGHSWWGQRTCLTRYTPGQVLVLSFIIDAHGLLGANVQQYMAWHFSCLGDNWNANPCTPVHFSAQETVSALKRIIVNNRAFRERYHSRPADISERKNRPSMIIFVVFCFMVLFTTSNARPICEIHNER